MALRRCLAAVSLALMASCALPPPTEPPTVFAQGATLVAAPATAAPKAYQIDPQATTLHILVYRSGALARLGHNHVVSSRSVRGSVWRGTTLEESGFDITLLVNDLIVDDSAARATEGDDFAASVSEDAKEGTKANMLRESLLDGGRYPEISIRSVTVQGDTNAPTVVAAIRIKDQTRQVTLPVTLVATASTVRVTGAFEIRQTDFGITPLSVALGALQVQDSIKIKFELVATAP